jgi:hypothetical protein
LAAATTLSQKQKRAEAGVAPICKNNKFKSCYSDFTVVGKPYSIVKQKKERSALIGE